MLQVLVFNTNYSIQHNSFICKPTNDSENVIQIIQFKHTVKEFQELLFNIE